MSKRGRFRISTHCPNEFDQNGRHRFEHWYRDNTVYFITARCRDKFPAFATTAAQDVFWDRFTCYTSEFGFVPWVTSLMNNHYHTLGYLKVGDNLGRMMQRIHGSVAKLVNDLLPDADFPSGKKTVETTISTAAFATKHSADAPTATPFINRFGRGSHGMR